MTKAFKIKTEAGHSITIGSLKQVVTLVLTIFALISGIFGGVTWIVKYHLDPVRLELQIQNCQRMERAAGSSFEKAQLTCDARLRLQ